ncbi:MAG TPA: hydroxymethylbilane synthase [Fibrobacteria bacterium]|nr:hydroxymethylbilane synthase [Fibrobacteria bacterium]
MKKETGDTRGGPAPRKAGAKPKAETGATAAGKGPAAPKGAMPKAKPVPGPKVPDTLVVGSRGSALALAQSNMICDRLREAHPGLEVRLEIIKTAGDADQRTKLSEFPAMGVFVKELQMALLSGTIDCAVHSLKDVPEDEPEGLLLAAFPEREDARDVLISDGRSLRQLPPGSKVGTGSPRRVLQLKAIRPDLEYVPIRGNVDTRVGKVRSGELEAVVLAAAGLRRLGRAADIGHSLSFQDMVPAIGQASLALECRASDARVRGLLSAVDDELTHAAVTLERRFMKQVGGGCKVPMAAHVYPFGEGWRMLAVLGDPRTGSLARVEQGCESGAEDWLLDEVSWRIEEECKDKGIVMPRDLPEHHLLKDPEA